MSDDAGPGDEAEKGGTSQGRWVPPPFVWQPHTAAENALIRKRQRSRAIAMAIALAAVVLLFYAISIAKMS